MYCEGNWNNSSTSYSSQRITAITNHSNIVSIKIAKSSTIRRILEHYDNFDEDSDDELDKASNSKVAQNMTDEHSAVATSAGTFADIQEQNQKLDNCPHQSPQATQPFIRSTGAKEATTSIRIMLFNCNITYTF